MFSRIPKENQTHALYGNTGLVVFRKKTQICRYEVHKYFSVQNSEKSIVQSIKVNFKAT